MNVAALLAVAAAASALAAIWLERGERRHRAFYALKPLTTLLLIALAAAGTDPAGRYAQLVLLGLALSLLGDVCLMFRGERWFLGGLGSFLLAHIAFIAAFLQGVAQVSLPGWLALVVLGAIAMMIVLLPRAGILKAPVLVYCAVLVAMVFAAAARHAALGGTAATLALAGALVFMLSDASLGVRQFVRRFRGAQPLILSTYWTAIGLIAAST